MGTPPGVPVESGDPGGGEREPAPSAGELENFSVGLFLPPKFLFFPPFNFFFLEKRVILYAFLCMY